MNNYLIRNRLNFFQAELLTKKRDTGFTVNETRFICERAICLIKDYSSPGITPLKQQILLQLQDTLDQADRYYSGFDRQRRIGAIPYTEVVNSALEALNTFLIKTQR